MKYKVIVTLVNGDRNTLEIEENILQSTLNKFKWMSIIDHVNVFPLADNPVMITESWLEGQGFSKDENRWEKANGNYTIQLETYKGKWRCIISTGVDFLKPFTVIYIHELNEGIKWMTKGDLLKVSYGEKEDS